MTAPRQTSDATARVLAAAGIEVTDEGRARARARLAAADARMTPQRWAEMRARHFRNTPDVTP